MATILLSAAGAAAGAAVGGGVLGLSSVAIGRAVGATLGRVLDAALLGSGSGAVETGRTENFRLTQAGEGGAMTRLYGQTRLAGQVIWASNFLESLTTTGSGKGVVGGAATTQYSYSVSLAIALCAGEITHVGRIWADGTEIAATDLNLRLYTGAEDQLPDPAIEAVEGSGNAPAYRGVAYVVLEDLQLGQFGNRVPQFTFEVLRPGAGAGEDLSRAVQGVSIIPGTGEYGLATTPVYQETEPGVSVASNVNTPLGGTDFSASLAMLTGELPNCGAASLVVSWFGDDLRCGSCNIGPRCEQTLVDGSVPWRVSGLDRSAAGTVPLADGAPVYGGTPADAAVVEAIAALQAAGQAVTFYPFILMEQQAANARPDPYSDAVDQPVLPWRGRITTSKAPGQAGSPDGTAAATAEVDAFFGTAQPSDFTVSGTDVSYTGPPETSYRRFILHYAHLCAAAGGVDAFCIGSEMRALTQIRSGAGLFPAVAQLQALAADVRQIVGAGVAIGYAADWSEYFGYHPQDGSGDVWFHLDPLWADANIDFIGIDNYLPLSDWRDGGDHADADAGSIYAPAYLAGNVEGGEGYDWYYASDAARQAQTRTAIADAAHGEDWLFRVKDFRNWWLSPHHDRPGGARSATPTAWVPQSKPIWFTEIGCAAVDKGSNAPNRFVDPKSSESGLPTGSNGRRDDLVQRQYLLASIGYWSDAANNPVSEVYGGPMVDMTRAHVWAWDARPYPFFPGNQTLWADHENWQRGHWINGRVAARGLAGVVAEICAEAGVADVDVSELFGLVRGYAVDRMADARAALQPLMLAHGFEAVERAGALLFRNRSGVATASVAASEIAVSAEAADIQFTRTPDAESFGRVKLSFVSGDSDYQTGTAEAILPDDPAGTVATSDLPLVLTAFEAGAIAERWLAEARLARETARFSLPMSRVATGAGDVVTLDGKSWRIDRVEQLGAQTCEAVRVDPSVYAPSDAVEETVAQVPFVAPVPVLPVFLDLPLLTGDEVPHAPHLAVSATPWPGSVAVYDSASDQDFALNTLLAGAATLGVTESPLYRAPPAIWDRGAALRVRMLSGTLAARSEADVLGGANIMAIGNGDDDVWELFQFSDCQLVAPDSYDLGVRLRGQAGTDSLIPDAWPVGSRVVLISAAVAQVVLASAQRRLARTWRVGPSGRPVDDPIYRQEVRAFDGIGLRPYAPVFLRASDDGSDLDIGWLRRTRLGGDSWDGLDVPLGETYESYRVQLLQGGALVREAIVAAPSWRYDAASRSADGLTGPVDIEVAQISDLFGPGLAARISVTL